MCTWIRQNCDGARFFLHKKITAAKKTNRLHAYLQKKRNEALRSLDKGDVWLDLRVSHYCHNSSACAALGQTTHCK